MTSLTAHESTAALCKASVGKIALFLSLKIVHRAQMPKQAKALAALQSVLVTLWHHHQSISSALGSKPSCQGGSQSADTEPHSTKRPSLVSHIPTGHLAVPIPAVRLACKQPWQETVCRRGDTCLGDIQSMWPPRPCSCCTARHWLCLCSSGQRHPPAWGQAHLKAAGPQSFPGEP